jgi:glycosyltransferase involved in cell wall biosynthesis
MYKVSVIVPVYNAGKHLEKCVRSLFEQTLSDIEYIFVNDCTPDNSMEILETIIREYPERAKDITIINHERNTGQSGARKDGMKVASGEYIIHCDADDWIDLDMYECMYNKAKEDDVEAVCCDIVMEFLESRKILRVNGEHDDHRLMYECKAPISVEYFSMCNRMVSRKVYERHTIEPFEGVNMWDDVGLATRVRFYCRSTSVINREFYHYNRQNEVSTTRRPLDERYREQSLCIDFIEQFFRTEGVLEKYRLFISYLRAHSAEDIFRHDIDLWRETFEVVKNDLKRLPYKKSRLRRFNIAGNGGYLGKIIWTLLWKR